MTADATVMAECRVYASYLADANPSSYVIEAYERLRPTASRSTQSDARLIERSLVAMSRWGALPLRVADGYARFFLPRSLLRRRLVLMLAILENSADGERQLNSGDEGSLVGVGVRLMLTGVVSVLCIAIGVVCFAPLHLLSGSDSTPIEAAH